MATKLDKDSIKSGARGHSGKRMTVANGRVTRLETGVDTPPVTIKTGKKGK